MVVLFAKRCSDVVCVKAWKVVGTINSIETRLKAYCSPPATSLPTSPVDKGSQNIKQKKIHHPLPIPFICLSSYILPSIVHWYRFTSIQYSMFKSRSEFSSSSELSVSPTSSPSSVLLLSSILLLVSGASYQRGKT
jgi:hypothetical protein